MSARAALAFASPPNDQVRGFVFERRVRRHAGIIGATSNFGESSGMNRKCLHRHRVILLPVLACAALALSAILPGIASGAEKSSAPAAQKNQEAGRLIITRSSRLSQVVVGLSIDGKPVAKINYNNRYDAPLAAGPHTLTVVPIPDRELAGPTSVQVNVQPGKTYTFTAALDDVRVVLK